MIRCMTDYWNPGEEYRAVSLLERQHRIYDWNMRRLQLVSKRSNVWNRQYPLIAQAQAFCGGMWPVMASPLSGDTYITLSELQQYNDSVFLLDARMTEILFALQVLHDDGFMLGAVSPALFGVSIDGEIARTELLDLSGAMSVDDLPMPEAIMPDPESIEFLSPELAQYIAVSPKEGTDDLLDMQEWLGPASDIFSLGLIYHLILTGRMPKLIHPEYGNCANAICHEARPEDAVELDESINGKRSELIYRMLRMNPLDRPMRCDEIVRRILDFYTA
ncbi:MAG: hypothetical protein Q4E13_05605 [Clostridia bacterium]|nr:hypothetical protein [Clostridia bacterium]